MIDWTLVIVSYSRAQTLRDKTLSYLATTDVPRDRIEIFVANDSEAVAYREAIGPDLKIIVGEPGMRAIRNFVQQHYETGAKLFCLDDDIEALHEKVDDKTTRPLRNLVQFVDTGFDLAEKTKLRLWGVGAVLNPFFMSNRPSTNLKYIVGCAWGCINDRDPALSVTLDDKEDFERSLKYYLADGGVLRLNWVAPKTRYYKEPGGMQVTRTPKRVNESALILAQRYPMLCSLKHKKTSSHLELRLHDKRKTIPETPKANP